MTSMLLASTTRRGLASQLLDRRFEAVVFDWDGTAVPNRQADATEVRQLFADLSAAGLDLFVVTGTDVGDVDGQLGLRPPGPGRLLYAVDRGSQVFAATDHGLRLIWQREATVAEERALDLAAQLTVEQLADAGLHAEIVGSGLNRRKVDVIPLPEWGDPSRARIDELLDAVRARLAASAVGDPVAALDLSMAAARTAGLPDPRGTGDVKHLEIGLTNKSHSVRWALDDLAERGIGAGLVLVAGDEFGPIGGVTGSDAPMLVPEILRAVAISVGAEPGGVPEPVHHLGGGPPRFLKVMTDQLQRRRAGRVPDIDPDPAWTIAVENRPTPIAAESLLTVSDGVVGTRGVLEEMRSSAAVRVNGIYDDSAPLPSPNLLAGPTWTSVRVNVTDSRPGRRVLDLRTGVLRRDGGGDDSLRSLRFANLSRPGVVAMRVEGNNGSFSAAESLTAPPGGTAADLDGRRVASAAAPHGGIVAAATQRAQTDEDRHHVERLAAYLADPAEVPAASAAVAALATAEEIGFDGLLAEQRTAWARRWADCQVDIEGDPETELAVRFAIFHLLASAKGVDETALGARGLSGPGYAGHVFWDADIFALPTLAALLPEAARAMLEYRLRRLEPARANAARTGRAGARFPWESACEGTECTPTAMLNDVGEVIEILTGELEEHITADVAWAAWRYADWTGDEAFRTGTGAPLVVETARYWASRVEPGPDGRGHLRRVIGPDEYHEGVDDNAFTNVMARWNLRRAADLVELAGVGAAATPLVDPAEAAHWRAVADSLVDGYDPDTGLYEQYDGFFDLQPFVVSEVLQLPAAADLVLGRAVTLVSQIIKQADVLMMQFLVPEEVVAGSLEPNLDYYGPRTSHGSSLSPGVHAALLARAGRPDEGLRLLRMASHLDLHDLTHTTAGGLHIATLGGLWQAVATGFAGITVDGGVLGVHPQLPASWRRLSLRLRYHGRRVRLGCSPAEVHVETDGSLRLRLSDGIVHAVSAPGARFGRSDDGWRLVEGPAATTPAVDGDQTASRT